VCIVNATFLFICKPETVEQTDSFPGGSLMDTKCQQLRFSFCRLALTGEIKIACIKLFIFAESTIELTILSKNSRKPAMRVAICQPFRMWSAVYLNMHMT